jgi:hypothetical protein
MSIAEHYHDVDFNPNSTHPNRESAMNAKARKQTGQLRVSKKPGSEFLAIDKKTVAIHEAGHAVVALKLGCPYAKLTLERDHSRNLETEVAFRARCSTPEIKGKLNISARGYAGVIAEMLYDGLELNQYEVKEYLDFEMWTPSLTDMMSIETVSPNWHKRARKLSLDLLQANWTAVRGVAYALHESPDGEIYVLSSFVEQNRWLGLL